MNIELYTNNFRIYNCISCSCCTQFELIIEKEKNKTFRGIREKDSLFSQRSRSRAWYANVPWVHQRNSRRECFQMLDRDRKVETNRGNYPTEDWNGPQHQDHLLIRRLPMWPQNAREKNRLRRFVLYIFLMHFPTNLISVSWDMTNSLTV